MQLQKSGIGRNSVWALELTPGEMTRKMLCLSMKLFLKILGMTPPRQKARQLHKRELPMP